MITLSEGDGVYAMRFRLTWSNHRQNFVVVRSGIIARIWAALAEKQDSFLIDSFAFPGNSVGPVIAKPEPYSAERLQDWLSVGNRAKCVSLERDLRPKEDHTWTSRLN